MALISGAPKLLRNAPRAIVITLIGNAITSLWNFLFPGPQWGVFLPGTADEALEVSSVLGMGIVGSSRTSDYPLQSGSFVQYNKVSLPDIHEVILASDGDEQQKAFFLSWLKDNKASTTLFDVVSPEMRWPNATLTDYRIVRSRENGASMITASCLFQQIREIPAIYSRQNIASPENEPTSPTARVNAQPSEPVSGGGAVSWQ